MNTFATQETLDDFCPGDGQKKLPARLGVIGNPIAHSCSPQMQQTALDIARLPYRYIRIQSEREEGAFARLLAALEARHFLGLNVTIPFKKDARALSRRVDALAQLCGTVNTLVPDVQGGWQGYNTDGPGFETAVSELCGKPLSALRIALLGACGGAGRALASQCVLSGCPDLVLINRPRPELEELTNTLRPHATGTLRCCSFGSEAEEQAVRNADLIVNATSLGLKEGDALPLPPEWLQPGQMVYDIVTHDTPLTLEARERGCLADNGLAMLLWQGAYAFRHWFSRMPDVEAMRRALTV